MTAARAQAHPRLAVGATLLAATLWGTSFNVNDLGLAHVGPATFVVLRFAIAAVVMGAAALWLRRLDASLFRSPAFWALAAANALGFLLQYFGQVHTTPARTALFVNTSAFFVALLERAFFGLRIGPARGLAIAVGVAGAALLITGGDVASLRGGRLLGDLLVLAGGLAWSFFFVWNRRAVGEHDVVGVTAAIFVATTVLLLPTVLLDARPLVVPPQAAWAVLYAGLVTTALAFGLWAWGLTAIRATTSSILLLVEILVAALVSTLLGRESFGPYDYAGAALLVASVVAMSLFATDEARG